MVAKLLYKLLAAFKMNCMNDVSAKTPLLQQAGCCQEAESKQRSSNVSKCTVLKKKITSVVASLENLKFSKASSPGKKISTFRDEVDASDLQLQLVAHFGIPVTTCTMAFDPIQNLFAVATRDGCIKIFSDTCMEVLLQSPTHVPCHFLQFMYDQGRIVNVTTTNIIEVWDIGMKSMAAYYAWETEITAFAIVQGSPFMCIGEDSGILKVLQYNIERSQLDLLPYSIPTTVTLAGYQQKTGEAVINCHSPSIISILPQPEAELERVLIAYGNGFIVLWQFHGHQVVAAWGPYFHLNRTSGYLTSTIPSSTDEKEDRELSCICWTCRKGTSFASGYNDGNVCLWTVPPICKPMGRDNQGIGSEFSRIPAARIEMCSNISRMPIFMIKWWPIHTNYNEGLDGHLCIFGGEEFGCPEVLKVISLKHVDGSFPKHWVELPLFGPLADVLATPSFGSFIPTTIFILVSQGCLYAYDIAQVSERISNSQEGKCLLFPEPVTIKLPVSESSATVAKLFSIVGAGRIANNLLQLPRILKSGFPVSVFPTVGTLIEKTQSKDKYIYITGHVNGVVNIWDISDSQILSICSLNSQENVDNDTSPVTALDWCSISGFLSVGKKNGTILIYKLGNQVSETKERTTKQGTCIDYGTFQFITSFAMHQAAISSLTISASRERLAAGCKSGAVSLINLKALCLIYHGKCFGTSAEIISVRFADIPLSNPGFSTLLSPKTPSSMRGQSSPPTPPAVILIATSKDSSMVVINVENGVCYSGPFQPRHPSIAVSLYLLDPSGTPFAENSDIQNQTTFSSFEKRNKHTSEDMLKSDIPGPTNSAYKLNNINDGEERRDSSATESSLQDTPLTQPLVLLCSEDSLRVYYLTSMLQGLRSHHMKIKLQKVCIWTSVFHTASGRPCLLLLYRTGELEFRSLPDMFLLKETSISSSLNWHIKLDDNLLRTISSTANGQIVWIDDDKELNFFSILDEKNSMRTSVSLSNLQGKEIKQITEAVAAVSQTHKKGLLSGVIKEIKGGVKKNSSRAGEISAVHKLSQLAKILGASNFAAASFSQLHDGSTPENSKSTDIKDKELEIDDIDLEDQNYLHPTLQSKESQSRTLIKKVKAVLKGPKVEPKHSSAAADIQDFETSREGHARTLSEIKARYGHRKAMDASTTAAHARDKLLQRGEKLQEISRCTEEMQRDAENFHNLTEEFVKSLERKKWGF